MERYGRKPVTRVVAWTAAVAIGAAVLLAASRILSLRTPAQSHQISIRGPALRFAATQILFVSRSSGFALAADETPGTVTGPLSIYRTGNGGRSWVRVLTTTLNTAASVKLRPLGSSKVALVGLTGISYVASDSGGAWKAVRMPAQIAGAAFVSFASPSVWYAMGNIRGGMGRDTYTVYRSGNTGKTWTAMQKFTGHPATGIAFEAANAGAGWIGQIPPNPGWVTWG